MARVAAGAFGFWIFSHTFDSRCGPPILNLWPARNLSVFQEHWLTKATHGFGEIVRAASRKRVIARLAAGRLPTLAIVIEPPCTGALGSRVSPSVRNEPERDEFKNLPFSSRSTRECYRAAG